MAVGMFFSSLTESQALAAFLTFIVLLAWFVIRFLAPGADEPWRSIANYLSFGGQLSTLFRGVLELKALVFFGSVIALSFLLTHRTVELQRWA
jgi:ABC-2 type transport system permease protein